MVDRLVGPMINCLNGQRFRPKRSYRLSIHATLEEYWANLHHQCSQVVLSSRDKSVCTFFLSKLWQSPKLFYSRNHVLSWLAPCASLRENQWGSFFARVANWKCCVEAANTKLHNILPLLFFVCFLSTNTKAHVSVLCVCTSMLHTRTVKPHL